MMRTRALLLVVISVCAGMSGTAEMSDVERRRLLAHMEMTAAWLVDEIAGLSAAQFHFRAGPGQWSVAEVLEHLVVVAPIYTADLQAALRQAPRSRSAMTDADVLWYGIDRTRREQAIATERPPGKLRDVAAGLLAYREHHARLVEFVKTTREDLRGRIVERQGCDAYQWALLISTHEQRHVLQIREIAAHADFPKEGRR
jgi:DinB superfamily